MNENLNKFFEEMSKNDALATKLMEINKKITDKEENAKALAELAEEVNIYITADDILNADNNFNSDELSEEELEQISGGYMMMSKGPFYTEYRTDCLCIAGGGGTGDELQKTCACVLGGAGKLTQEGRDKFQSNGSVMSCHLIGTATGKFEIYTRNQ